MDDFRPFELIATSDTRTGGAVATIHNTEDRCFDVVCSRHWLIYSHGYREDASAAEVKNVRKAAARRGFEHTTACEVAP